MIKLTVTENQANQRLDRFLKKYFDLAPLSHIYKMIRKDVKINGKRKSKEHMLSAGDEITIYISEEEGAGLQKKAKRIRAKKQFRIAYEDRNLLIVEKPFGLLTHGDKTEKKNHLANQVTDYLIEKGEYDPRDRMFTPSPVGRLDRNTTGLVMFGKNAETLRQLNHMTQGKEAIGKYYLTIVEGRLDSTLHLRDKMTKDAEKNQVTIVPGSEEGKWMETVATPLEKTFFHGRWYTLTQVEILTGRTHQIRVHLAKAGYPVIGDVKYGLQAGNRIMREAFGLNTHLLHAWKLVFRETYNCEDSEGGMLDYLRGKTVISGLPPDFQRIKDALFGKNLTDIGDKRP